MTLYLLLYILAPCLKPFLPVFMIISWSLDVVVGEDCSVVGPVVIVVLMDGDKVLELEYVVDGVSVGCEVSVVNGVSVIVVCGKSVTFFLLIPLFTP